MFMKDNNGTYCGLYCSCGCNDGIILKTYKDSEGCDLSLVSDAFYETQKTGWTRFKKKCRRIWSIIRNEEYSYFEICIEPEDLKEFKEFVAKM